VEGDNKMPAYAYKMKSEDLLEYIKEQIQQSDNKVFEAATQDLAKHFNVSAPTIDYHLKKLVRQKHLRLLPETGKYNRKLYALQPKTEFNLKDLDEFKKILNEKLQNKDKSKGKSTNIEKTLETVEKPKDNIQKQEEKQDKTEKAKTLDKTEEKGTQQEIAYTEDIPDFPNLNQEEPKIVHELTLDEQIEKFLEDTKNVATPEQLLTKEDREVLSVMNETIQQNIIYLKDLSQQLSTVQNKNLIQQLIDDRNRLLEENKMLREENNELRKQHTNQENHTKLDRNRLRNMQQNLIFELDNWLSLPNHALALKRREFHEAHIRNINEVFDYVLGLEK